MNLIHAIILGIIEGITEFLPISSTAHLIISSRLLSISQTEFQKFFEVFIQSGAIFAIVVLYLEYIFKNKQIVYKVIVSFIPTAVIGFFLYRVIKNVFFESKYLMAMMFFLIGIGFIFIEYLIKQKKIKLNQSAGRLNLVQAFFIGLAQSLAVIPGVSRAGIVLLTMMFMGFKRDEAAAYSFLLAVPTILAASGYDLYKSKDLLIISPNNLSLLTIGFFVSFIFAFFSVKWLIGYLQKNSLTIFGIYRIIIALLLFMV